MADSTRDADVDALYQLPPSDFTAARNALAKTRGAEGPAIRALEKPHAAAWGVNQLYWRHRAQFDAVIAAALDMRQTHARLLSGQTADVADAEARHHATVREATETIDTLMRHDGAAVSAATREAIRETLLALPSAEADGLPGRLTRPLKPLGFGALLALGLSPTPSTSKTSGPSTQPASSGARKAAAAEVRRAKAEWAKRKNALTKALRTAEQREHAAEVALLHATKAQKKVEREYAAARDRLQFLEKQRDDADQAIKRQSREVQDAANARTRAAQDLDACREEQQS